MSIDFSKVKGLSDSRGNIVQITDAAGRVLWNAVEKVKVTVRTLQANANASVVIDGVSYGSSFADAVVSVPVGTVITCKAGYYDGLGKVYLDGTVVASVTSLGDAVYDYAAMGDTMVYLSGDSDNGQVNIDSIVEPEGLVYLRPSADVSVGAAATLVPSDATAAYLLLNEELCDGDATKIMLSGTGDERAPCTFSLSGATPNKINSVKKISIHTCAAYDGNFKYRGLNAALILNGNIQYNYSVPIVYENLTGYLPQEYDTISTRVDLTTNASTAPTTEEFLSEINGYLAAYGTLPSLELYVRLTIGEDYGDTKVEHSVSLSQAYVVIECE